MTVRVRYAPSPTGSQHVGNLRTAIYNWLFARSQGGMFIARLEDTDRTPERYKPEAVPEIESNLRYLGIVPDEWWVDGGPVGPYIQSERLQLYRDHAEALVEAGKAYRCWCTRERLEAMRAEQQERGLPTGYDRRCRDLSLADRERNIAAGAPSVIRLRMPLEGRTVVHDEVRGDIVYENRTQDDQVLLKSDGFPTYFLACVVDDHLMGISHVIRGDDWLSSAAKFVAVIDAFGWEPPRLVHPPLILGPDRKKLSKRHGATTFSEFVDGGYLPDALFNFLVLLGWSTGEENLEILSREEILARFTLDGLSEHPAIFDYEKLRWMNGHYIRALPLEELAQACLPFLQRAGLVAPEPDNSTMKYLGRVLALEQERIKTLADVPEMVSFFLRNIAYPADYDEKGTAKWLGPDTARPVLSGQARRWDSMDGWTAALLEDAARSVAADLSLPFAHVVHPTRMAATGRTVGPSLFDTLEVLGRERVMMRIATILAP